SPGHDNTTLQRLWTSTAVLQNEYFSYNYFSIVRRQPRYTLFPYTTLFRSQHHIPPGRGITGAFQCMVLHLWSIKWRNLGGWIETDRKSTRLNSSHVAISYAVFCLKK